MNDELRTTVLSALTEVAPEVDPSSVQPDVPLQDQLDLDSMDYLQFLENLSETTGIDIPERAYGSLATIDDCVAFLSRPVPQP